MAPTEPGWNHNSHYWPVLLAAVPSRCRDALDVGCGEGGFTRELAKVSERVVGLDRSSDMVAVARASGVDAAEGDILDLPCERYDFVSALMVVHHVELRAALTSLAGAVRPGGVVAVLGLARSRAPVDWAFDGVGFFATRAYALRRTRVPVTAPVADPTDTYDVVRRVSAEVLPGRQYRRRVLFRYTLLWTKPDV